MRKLVCILFFSAPLTAASFDYFLFTLSWAPDFCAQAKGFKDPAECGPGKKRGFVVHGMWPQAESARGPENCGPARPVAASLVQTMLNYMPTASLIQHEWKTHGTCSGMSAAEYFAAIRMAHDWVKIPPEFQAPSQAMQITPDAIEAAFQKANPQFPRTAIRTSCRGGALQEVRICFDKGEMTPRDCSVSAGECSAARVSVLPVR